MMVDQASALRNCREDHCINQSKPVNFDCAAQIHSNACHFSSSGKYCSYSDLRVM
jgi:hypothetical protein